jgi:hypothetical protein
MPDTLMMTAVAPVAATVHQEPLLQLWRNLRAHGQSK